MRGGLVGPMVMVLITRRNFLAGIGSFGAGGAGLSSYALAIEPLYRLVVTRYRIAPQGWPSHLRLRIAALADLHACEPWLGADRIRQIVEATNALDPDLTLLLGDYVVGHRWITSSVPVEVWAPLLGQLRARHGVHAVLGNHDWWHDRKAQIRGHGPVIVRTALEQAGIRVYENDVLRLKKDGQAFWIAGLGDQMALIRRRAVGWRRWKGVDDLEGTLAKVKDDAPLILMAHEPDIFPAIPRRVALTLCGHTHGGQLRILGYSPVVPSRYGNRYAYGHVVEDGRHLVVSGGLGCSAPPVRFGVPPEIVLVELGASAVA
jgi:predicted MPP superfamily phosphohydrolase